MRSKKHGIRFVFPNAAGCVASFDWGFRIVDNNAWLHPPQKNIGVRIPGLPIIKNLYSILHHEKEIQWEYWDRIGGYNLFRQTLHGIGRPI